MAFSIYIIDLDPKVLGKRRFRNANPDHRDGMRCMYVGSTFKDVKERFEQHKKGIKANRYVREFGLGPIELDRKRFGNFKSRNEVEKVEEAVALRLRNKGYAVWFGI